MTCTPNSPLHEAAKNNDADKIRALAAEGKDVNQRVQCDRIPTPSFTYKREDIRGFAPDSKPWDKSQLTPLHIAVIYKAREAASALIECGAEVNAPDGQGKTPLDWVNGMGEREDIDALLRENKGKHGRE